VLEFLLEPLIDMQYFGCPDECIVPNSQTHESINFLVTPIVWIIIGVGVAFLVMFFVIIKRLGKLKRKRKEKIRIPDYASRIVEQAKPHDFEKSIRKKQKKEFLRSDLKDLNPEQAFENFVKAQDPEHPQADILKTVRTTTKEDIIPPENTVLENMKEVNVKVEKLMREEKLTEDQAVDRIINESTPNETSGIVACDVDEDDDVFQQDIPPRKYPKQLQKLEKTFKKKDKLKVKFHLNDLGKTRRDQYASQIESKISKWALPMPEYIGKNKEFQLSDEQINLGIKRLSLFLSMGEMMCDKKGKKKRYWSKIKLAS